MIERLITMTETVPMSVVGWVSAFMGIVWIRYFLEAFSNPNISGYVPSDLPTLLHYTLFYLAAVVTTVIAISPVARVSPLRMMRSLIFILPIMWLGPLIDLARGGAPIAYLFATTPGALFRDFITYFGPFTNVGVTLGLRIELGLLVLLLGCYVYAHTRRLWSALMGSLIGYVVIFIMMSLPSLLTFLFPANGAGTTLVNVLQDSLVSRNFLHPSEAYSAYRTAELLFDAAMAQLCYLILCFSGLVWLYSVRKEAVRAMLGNIRPERLLHFLLAALLGGLIASASGSHIAWTVFDSITIVTAVVTIAFAWVFAVITNDIVDKPIDAISNTGRPLITGELTDDLMRLAALVTGMMTLIGALALGSYATFWIGVFTATYYLYSVPPLRLKRIPLLASVCIGIATLASMLLGFFLVSENQELAAFPGSIAVLVVLFMSLITNVRDLKDLEGDAAAGIRTLPTLLGDRRARVVIGLMMLCAYVLVPLFIPVRALWAPSLVVGVVSWVGLMRGKGERFVFPLYFLYLACVVALLHFA